jgi:uncharacterized protein (TIGR02145 family)
VSINDQESFGDLYQWGRFSDGHQCRTSATTSALSSTDQPTHADFITMLPAGNAENDWRSPQNDNLWQGLNGINNPCPAGFRIPTGAELKTERESLNPNNAAGAFASPLKFTMAGYRDFNSGDIAFAGQSGYYWSSTIDEATAEQMFILSGTAGMSTNPRAFGGSVRCIKD